MTRSNRPEGASMPTATHEPIEDRIREATRNLLDAQREAADSQRQYADAIADAQKRLVELKREAAETE